MLSSLTSITIMQAAWLWWLDIDTAIVNLTRPLPLGDYEGRDLIGWGNYERLKAGDMMQGAFPENASLPTTSKALCTAALMLCIRRSVWVVSSRHEHHPVR